MQNGTMTMRAVENPDRKGFCVRCDAPLYEGESTCLYCGGGPSAVDFQAVFVLSLLVLSGLGVLVLLLK